MVRFIGFIGRLWEDRSGATTIEYGLIAAGIAVAIIAAIALFGENLAGMFNGAS